jgi:hypothetical protein
LPIAIHHSTLASALNSLLKPLFDPFELRMEVECSSLFEGEFQLDNGVIRRDASSRNGLEGRCPDIGAEERRRDVGVVEI